VVGALQQSRSMGTQVPLAAPSTELLRSSESLQVSDKEALASTSVSMAQEQSTLSPLMGRLPVELEVAVPVRNFRVRTLLSLEKGKVIETQWGHGDDLPLSAGDVQLAWSEFEVIETRLAVRVTRIA
jgi:flagellar motor switch protein FliM